MKTYNKKIWRNLWQNMLMPREYINVVIRRKERRPTVLSIPIVLPFPAIHHFPASFIFPAELLLSGKESFPIFFLFCFDYSAGKKNGLAAPGSTVPARTWGKRQDAIVG